RQPDIALGVDGRDLRRGMPQDAAHRLDAAEFLQQPGGAGVAQLVEGPLVDSRRLAGADQRTVQRVGAVVLAEAPFGVPLCPPAALALAGRHLGLPLLTLPRVPCFFGLLGPEQVAAAG